MSNFEMKGGSGSVTFGSAKAQSKRNDEAVDKEEESAEIAEFKELCIDARSLMDNRLFQKVILDGYIRDTALDIGTSFDGSDTDIDALRAITQLQNYLNSLVQS